MSETVDNIKKILQHKITEHLGHEFTLERYFDSCDTTPTYIVTGTIVRFNSPANVRVTVNKESFKIDYWLITDETVTMSMRYIGAINLGNDVCVSDPSYNQGVWCMTTLNNVKPGLWKVEAAIDTIDAWGERVYILELRHRDEKRNNNHDWTERTKLGVDSGMMSVFNEAYYNGKNGSNDTVKPSKTAIDRFYDRCCKLTDNYMGIYRAGNKAVGVVCSSGCGDGSYPLYVAEKDGEIVAIKISFM